MRRLTYTIATVILGLLVAGASAAGDQQEKPVRAKASAGSGAPVNLNTATQAQLESLPGIGASTAKRIVEYRQKSGGFKKVEDLMNVKGVGEKSFLKIKDSLTVGAPRAEKSSTSAPA